VSRNDGEFGERLGYVERVVLKAERNVSRNGGELGERLGCVERVVLEVSERWAEEAENWESKLGVC